MKILLLLLTFLSSAYTFASDAGLDQLRQSLLPIIQNSSAQLDRAGQMKPIIVKQGTSLPKIDCEALKLKIGKNYKVSPFDFSYEGGSFQSGFCGGQNGYTPNYQQTLSGKSNFGLPYSKVVQLAGGPEYGNDRNWINNYFIDDSYRIVEIEMLEFVPDTGELFSYGISSVDSIGNVYISQYDKNFGFADTDIEGKRTYEVFKSIEGVVPEVTRLRIQNVDSAKDYEELSVHRADQKDWQSYELPITHAGANGFYNYGSHYYGESRFNSSLWIKSRGGREQCSWGGVKTDKTWVNYPSDQTALDSCVNL